MKNRKIEDLLDKLEFNIGNKGYTYWIDMINFKIQHTDMNIGDLVEKVAKKHNTTTSE